MLYSKYERQNVKKVDAYFKIKQKIVLLLARNPFSRELILQARKNLSMPLKGFTSYLDDKNAIDNIVLMSEQEKIEYDECDEVLYNISV